MLIGHVMRNTYHTGTLCGLTVAECSPVNLQFVNLHLLHSSMGLPQDHNRAGIIYMVDHFQHCSDPDICVSGCCVGVSGSDTAVLLKFLHTVHFLSTL